MLSISKSASTIAIVAMLTQVVALTQTSNNELNVDATATAPVAYVYVGTSKGVDLYDASPNGKVALVKGSPFQTSGLAIGSNGKYFISLGTYWVHAYPVSSTGTIGRQVSTIDTQDYYGSGECAGVSEATVGLAKLDHTGHNLYVAITIEDGDCPWAIQTYNISKSGDLTFNGGIFTGNNSGGLFQMPTITGNDKLAFGGYYPGFGNPPEWLGYERGSDGELQNLTFNLSNGLTSPYGYAPFYIAADPTNHLAAIVAYPYDEDSYYSPAQLASYTVDSNGNLTSTATADNMPYPAVKPSILNMSPSGKLLAVAGAGLQVFHFNGGSPITPYSKVLTTVKIDSVHWDNSDHLYALSESSNQLFVYTVTPTTVNQVPGSPYKVSESNALIVVPK